MGKARASTSSAKPADSVTLKGSKLPTRLEELAALFTPEIAPDRVQLHPFEGEKDYWDLIFARFQTLSNLRDIESQRIDLSNASRNPELVAQLPEICHRLEQHAKTLQSVWQNRRNLTSIDHGCPRLLRYAKRAQLDEEELDVLHCLVFTQLNSTKTSYGETEVQELASLLRFDAETIFRIFDPRSKLSRLGLLYIDENLSRSLRRRDVRVEPPVIKALRGFHLDADEQVILGVESLEELLAEEEGGGGEPRSTAVAASPPTSQLESQDASEEPTSDRTSQGEDPSSDSPAALAQGLENDLQPYRNDLDYLEDCSAWFRERYRLKAAKLENESPDHRHHYGQEVNPHVLIRQAEVRERLARSRIERRLEATRTTEQPLPRAEVLAERRGLGTFEKFVLVYLAAAATMKRSMKSDGDLSSPSVGDLLHLFFDTFEDEISGRAHFYPDAPLIRESLLFLNDEGLGSDFLSQTVKMDHVLIDYLLGLEPRVLPGGAGENPYWPRVDLSRVVLNPEDKDLITRIVDTYPAYVRKREASGLDEVTPYGSGLVLLFYGPPGTGKTMLAEALASHLGKKVLLVNFPTLGMFGGDIMRLLFREARVHDAVLFFDECEGVFKSRSEGPFITTILTEIERHDGIVILATNRQSDLDEAMYRRITVALEFHNPDATQREAIWKSHITKRMQLAPDVSLAELARKYSLSGGLIRNAVKLADFFATSPCEEGPMTQAMFDDACRMQMWSRPFIETAQEDCLPSRSLAEVVLPSPLQERISEMVRLERSRDTLASSWGFTKERIGAFTTSALFAGPPGTGKTLCAEAIAHELERTLKTVDAAQLISKYVGEGAKNVQSIFREAQRQNAVLFFDEADALFAGRTAVGNSTDRYANLEVATLLREMENYSGVVILATNLEENIDPAFRRRIRFHFELPLPDQALRERLWTTHLPESMPLATDVSLKELAEGFELTGAEIRNAVIKAASRAALRTKKERRVTQRDLVSAAADQSNGAQPRGRIGFSVVS